MNLEHAVSEESDVQTGLAILHQLLNNFQTLFVKTDKNQSPLPLTRSDWYKEM